MIEVGDYIRLKNGDIGKYFIRQFINYIDINDNLWGIDIENDIVKYSKNIIDLIEVGDYVNGSKVIDIAQGKTKSVYIESQEQKLALIPIVEKQIKSIVTKEQFANIEYIVED